MENATSRQPHLEICVFGLELFNLVVKGRLLGRKRCFVIGGQASVLFLVGLLQGSQLLGLSRLKVVDSSFVRRSTWARDVSSNGLALRKCFRLPCCTSNLPLGFQGRLVLIQGTTSLVEQADLRIVLSLQFFEVLLQLLSLGGLLMANSR